MTNYQTQQRVDLSKPLMFLGVNVRKHEILRGHDGKLIAVFFAPKGSCQEALQAVYIDDVDLSNAPMFQVGDTWFTREGRQARVVATDAGPDYPNVAIVSGMACLNFDNKGSDRRNDINDLVTLMSRNGVHS